MKCPECGGRRLELESYYVGGRGYVPCLDCRAPGCDFRQVIPDYETYLVIRDHMREEVSRDESLPGLREHEHRASPRAEAPGGRYPVALPLAL